MKKLYLILVVGIFLKNGVRAQGLLEQSKFYQNALMFGSSITLDRDTGAYVNLDLIKQRISSEALINNQLQKSIDELDSKIKVSKKDDEEIQNLKLKIKLINEKASFAIKAKQQFVYDNLNNNLKAYKNGLSIYRNNINEIIQNRDTSKIPEAQRLRDSLGLVLQPLAIKLSSEIDQLDLLLSNYKQSMNSISSDNYLINDSICNSFFEKIDSFAKGTIDKSKAEIEQINQSFNDSYAKLVKANTVNTSDPSSLAALPSFTSLFNKFQFIPEISILAGRNLSWKSPHDLVQVSGEIRLFVSSSSSTTKDSSTLTDRQKVFVQSASNFGITSNFTFSGWKSKDSTFRHFAANLGVDIVGKNFRPDSLEQFNVSTLGIRGGVEFAFWKDLSVYANLNSIMFLDRIEELNKYLGVDRNKSYLYFDVGSKFLLSLVSDKTFSIFIDANLVIINPSVKKDIYPVKDPVFLNVKTGFRKNF